jgi:hypothetical protein
MLGFVQKIAVSKCDEPIPKFDEPVVASIPGLRCSDLTNESKENKYI